MKKVIIPLTLLVILMGWVQYCAAVPANQVLLKNIDVISSLGKPEIDFVFDGTPGEFDTSYHDDFIQVELPDTSVNPTKQWINVKNEFFRNIFVYQFDDNTVRARLYTNGNAVKLKDRIKLSKESDKIVLQYNISGGVSAASGIIPLPSVLKDEAKGKHLIPNASGPPEIYGSFFKMILVLGVLIALLLIVLYVVKRFLLKKTGKGGQDQSIKVITSAYVGPKKTIALVEVAGERIVVGITSDNISMLTKLNKDMEFNEVLNEQITSIPDETLMSLGRIKDDENTPPSPPYKGGARGGEPVASDETTEKKVEMNDELWEKA